MKTIITIIFVLILQFKMFGQRSDIQKSDNEFFYKNESETLYKKYPKSLVRGFENYVLIKDTIKIKFPQNLEEQYKLIIRNGFISPEITNNVNGSEYCCFEEIKNGESNFKTRRYKFWIFYPKTNNPLTNRINPDEYFFELQNEFATEGMEFETFLKDAKLTFMKFKTIII